MDTPSPRVQAPGWVTPNSDSEFESASKPCSQLRVDFHTYHHTYYYSVRKEGQGKGLVKSMWLCVAADGGGGDEGGGNERCGVTCKECLIIF